MSKTSKIMAIVIPAIILIILILILTIKDIKKTDKTKASSYSSENITTEEKIEYVPQLGEESDSSAYKLNILGITKEVQEKINAEELYTKIREYMYKTGLVEGDDLTLQQYEQDGSEMKLRFTLNDKNETRIIAITNGNGEYEIFYYR